MNAACGDVKTGDRGGSHSIQIVSTRNCQIAARDLTRIAFNETKNELLLTDSKEKSIKRLNLNCELEGTIKPTDNDDDDDDDGTIPLLETPYSLCVNYLNELAVYDWQLHTILIFDENYRLLTRIQLDAHVEYGKPVNYMTYDPFNPCHLYLTSTSQNKLMAMDTKLGRVVNETQRYDSPADIRIHDEHIYTTSSTSYSFNSIVKKFGKVITGSNCIFILNKDTLELVREIRHKCWMRPKGLYVDRYGCIWTTAFKIDDLNVASDCLYLFILSQYGDIVNLVSLSPIKLFSDFFMNEKKLLLCAANCLRVIEFDWTLA